MGHAGIEVRTTVLRVPRQCSTGKCNTPHKVKEGRSYRRIARDIESRADAAVSKAVSIDGRDLLRAGGPGAIVCPGCRPFTTPEVLVYHGAGAPAM